MAPPRSGISLAWRALRHRNFRLFFGGQSISLIGTWMTRIATAWLVYRLTGSAWLLGIVGFCGQIPTFLLAPFAGVWVDRLNRRHVLVVTQTLAMVQSLVLAALTLTHVVTITEILWLSIFQGMINAFDMPGRQAFMVQMIEDRQDLGNAIALNSSMVNMARLVGPIAGRTGDCGLWRRVLLSDRRHQLHCGDHFPAVDAAAEVCCGVAGSCRWWSS